MPRLDRSPQSRTLTKNVLLPHKLIQTPRPHPHRKRRIGSWNLGPGRFAGVKQSVSHYGSV
jgi:hypothetical protein